MVRQLNFYMGETEEKKFYDYLINLGFIIIDKFGKKCELSDSSYVLLIKEEFMQLLTFKEETVNASKSFLIEYIRTKVNEDNRTVGRGRIWYSGELKEIDNNNYKKVNSDFLKLLKWIKDNLPYQKYHNNGYELQGYISNELLIYSDDGYQFL